MGSNSSDYNQFSREWYDNHDTWIKSQVVTQSSAYDSIYMEAFNNYDGDYDFSIDVVIAPNGRSVSYTVDYDKEGENDSELMRVVNKLKADLQKEAEKWDKKIQDKLDEDWKAAQEDKETEVEETNEQEQAGFAKTNLIQSISDIAEWRKWFKRSDFEGEEKQRNQWYNKVDWENPKVSSHLEDINNRTAWANELGIDTSEFDVWWIDYAPVEENIEDTDEPEKSEFIGDKQQAIDPVVEPVEDQVVEVLDMQDGDGEDMAETKGLLDKLRNAQPSIPGLDVDALVEKALEKSTAIQEMIKPYKEIIDNPESTKEQIEKAKQDMEKQIEMMKNKLKEEIQEKVDEIRSYFKEIQDGVQDIPKAITQFISSMAIPKVVVAGSATGVANPATAIIEALQFKSQLATMLNQLNGSAIKLLNAAKKINFPVPSVVTSAIDGLGSLASAINSIPG